MRLYVVLLLIPHAWAHACVVTDVTPPIDADYVNFTFSPDRTSLAFTVYSPMPTPDREPPIGWVRRGLGHAASVWVTDLETLEHRQLTPIRWEDGWRSPEWSPDGRQLLVHFSNYTVYGHWPRYPHTMGILDVESGEFESEFPWVEMDSEWRDFAPPFWDPDKPHEIVNDLLASSGDERIPKRPQARTRLETTAILNGEVQEPRRGGDINSPFVVVTHKERSGDGVVTKETSLELRNDAKGIAREIMDSERFRAVSVAPDYLHAFVSGRDMTLTLFRADSPDPVCVIEDADTPLGYRSAWSPSGQAFVYAAEAKNNDTTSSRVWIVKLADISSWP